VRFRRGVALVLAGLALGAGACGGEASDGDVGDESGIYADLVVRLCDQARCGPSHPAFVLLEDDTAQARAGIGEALPDAVFISTIEGLIGPKDQVIEGGRILHVGPLRQQADANIVLVDTFWESSRFEGKGETYVYQWDGGVWTNVEPSTVSITVTTAVP
jgi:hypothetical protein